MIPSIHSDPHIAGSAISLEILRIVLSLSGSAERFRVIPFAEFQCRSFTSPSSNVGPETGETDGRLATDSGQVRGCDVKNRKLKRVKIGITSHIELNTHQSKSGNSYPKVLVPTFHILFRKRSPTKKIRPRSLS